MTISSPKTTKPSWKGSASSGHPISAGSVRKTLVVSCTMAMARRMHLRQKKMSSTKIAVSSITTIAAIW